MYDSYANQLKARDQFATWSPQAQFGPQPQGLQTNYQPTYGQSGGYFVNGQYRTGLNADPRVQQGRATLNAGQDAMRAAGGFDVPAGFNPNVGSGWLPGEGDAGAPFAPGGNMQMGGIDPLASNGVYDDGTLPASYNPALGGNPIGGLAGMFGNGNVGPAGTNGPGGMGTTLGSLAGGMSVPGTQPNYPLDIGSYLNPMMGYALGTGVKAINNSAAAAGNLNSGNTLRELMGYGMGLGSQNFNNAAGIAQGQQAFGYGVDKNDRDFAYNAQQNDRNFDLNKNLAQAGIGLQAQGQQLNANTQLAQLLATLGITGAQAASTGTIGGGNAITNAISQIISNYLGGKVVGGK
jgi:hypothetical protein